MNMEIIDQDRSSASAAIKSDRDIVFELWKPDSRVVFTGVSPEVQNDLTECTDSVIQDQIDSDVRECKLLVFRLMKPQIFLPLSSVP